MKQNKLTKSSTTTQLNYRPRVQSVLNTVTQSNVLNSLQMIMQTLGQNHQHFRELQSLIQFLKNWDISTLKEEISGLLLEREKLQRKVESLELKLQIMTDFSKEQLIKENQALKIKLDTYKQKAKEAQLQSLQVLENVKLNESLMQQILPKSEEKDELINQLTTQLAEQRQIQPQTTEQLRIHYESQISELQQKLDSYENISVEKTDDLIKQMQSLCQTFEIN